MLDGCLDKKILRFAKIKSLQTHKPTQKSFHRTNRQTKNAECTMESLTGDRTTGHNTGLKEMAGDKQVESFLLSITFVAGDSDERFSRHFFKPQNRYAQGVKDRRNIYLSSKNPFCCIAIDTEHLFANFFFKVYAL